MFNLLLSLAVVSGLFFLGHMSWAYVWAVVFAGRRGGKLFVPAVLMLGVLPDVDLFLGGFGVGHHMFFHSLFFWFVLFVPFLVVYRRRVVPYLVAVVQTDPDAACIRHSEQPDSQAVHHR